MYLYPDSLLVEPKFTCKARNLWLLFACNSNSSSSSSSRENSICDCSRESFAEIFAEIFALKIRDEQRNFPLDNKTTDREHLLLPPHTLWPDTTAALN